ncbi:MAG: MBOAT family protein, partial [Nitrospina sp.]|nr:MBOAT family protein [Nitrospina sp.]MBT7178694.1 MBOAT family protein [Nitrospina sp.]
MLFNSYAFIFLFLPVTLLGFQLIGNRGHCRVAVSWLIGASLFFYGWWNPAYLGLILTSILFNYAVGVSLGSRPAKTVLVVGIAANLGLLGYFKYANFFVDNINALTGSDIVLERIILPLAISFFTFQQITYLVDTYRGETQECDFLRYCLFVTFFPQLIAGPIVHHREMMPQFAKDTFCRLKAKHLAVGLTIFSVGLFKKVILADGIAVYSTPVFDAAEAGVILTFVDAWCGALAFTFQLYFDFSGYSDMAIGLGRMFGIILPVNFFSPYKASNIIEFWRRWHITLSRFARDYLYIPLGGNRKGTLLRFANLMITMLLIGLWHGAGWTFVIWGGLHGSYLVINHGWH